MIHSNKKIYFLLIILILLFTGNMNANPRVKPDRLPLVFIGYVCKVSVDIPRAVLNSASRKISDKKVNEILGPEHSILNKKLEQLNTDIPARLVFVKYVFISQANIPGHTSGFPVQKEERINKSSIPFETILFVTTPVESLGNKILVILSSVSPEQTRIFTIDTEYNVELLFDSFKKNPFKNTTIGSIHSMRVEKADEFVLEERSGRISSEARSISLTISNGDVKLKFISK